MKKLLIRLALSLLIGGAMLYLAVRRIEFSGVWSVLMRADWRLLAPFFVCMAVQHVFRAWRWGQLLAPIHPVPFSRILPISTVGFFAILALPLRMGEFVRPYLIADPPRIRMSQALGTMAVERVFDGLVVSLAAFSAVALAEARGVRVPGWVFGAGLIALGLFCVVLVVLVMTLWQRERAVILCRRLIGVFSKNLATRAANIAGGIVDGFKALPDARRIGPFLAATLAYWLFNVLALWAVAGGFGLGIGFDGAFGLTGLIGVGIMIPAGPGFIGNFELFAEGALDLYVPRSVTRQLGGAFIVAAHATNALWYVAAGMLAMFSAQVSFTRVWRASTESPADVGDAAAADEEP